ncbi:MAG: prepilin-type N-terminal cleavage/methylation domain-containing protein [Planctomycetes bacterium]|nr:prepilin-type N-terminal cleavage/methylation domain-containing protein [Planctomycetota bacterium]
MKHERDKSRAFTLVELLVVISIIGLLVSLLVPTVSMALLTARKNATQKILKELGIGIGAYHRDFGDYPRSRGFRAGDPAEFRALSGARQAGAANLVYYLRGPAGNGWGTEAGGWMPYDTVVASRPNRAFGPYYQTTPDAMAYEKDPVNSQTVPAAFLDAFRPPGRILYFRYERRPRHVSGSGTTAVFEPNYRVQDNDPATAGSAGGDIEGRVNYGDQAKFDEIIQIETYYTNLRRYVREDYLLVSPGPDGRYGWIVRDDDGNLQAASRLDENSPTYDDATNW